MKALKHLLVGFAIGASLTIGIANAQVRTIVLEPGDILDFTCHNGMIDMMVKPDDGTRLAIGCWGYKPIEPQSKTVNPYQVY